MITGLSKHLDFISDFFSTGCKPCWALIEWVYLPLSLIITSDLLALFAFAGRFRYALDIDLPDFVVNHPLIDALNQGTNDLVTWSNVSLLPHLLFSPT